MAAPGIRFDAAKHGKTPEAFLSNAPENAPAVRLGYISPVVGYGLFAARDFAEGEFIFHEAPLLAARFNERFSGDTTLVESQYQAYKEAVNDTKIKELSPISIISVAFPLIAAKYGFPPPPFEQIRGVLDARLGMNLVHGLFGGSSVTKKQYEDYRAKIESYMNSSPTEEVRREVCRGFFKDYAFEAKKRNVAGIGGMMVTRTSSACIYLLGSLINHCCVPRSRLSRGKGKNRGRGRGVGTAGPNCGWRIGREGLARFVLPQHLCVEALREIKKGEQLTWDYGKGEKGFDCECETCGMSPWTNPCASS